MLEDMLLLYVLFCWDMLGYLLCIWAVYCRAFLSYFRFIWASKANWTCKPIRTIKNYCLLVDGSQHVQGFTTALAFAARP